jgi:hypothetical protein
MLWGASQNAPVERKWTRVRGLSIGGTTPANMLDEDELDRQAVAAVASFDHSAVRRLLEFDPCAETFSEMTSVACELENLYAIVRLVFYAEKRAWRIDWVPQSCYTTKVNDLLALFSTASGIESELLGAACLGKAEWAEVLVRRYRVDARSAAGDVGERCSRMLHDRLCELVLIQRARERWDSIRAVVRRRRQLRRVFFAWLGAHVESICREGGVGRYRDRLAFEAESFAMTQFVAA